MRGRFAESAGEISSRVRGTAADSMADIRGGIERAIKSTTDQSEDSLGDSRLMVQIGMLLGFAYLGFLAVWFWATRGRAALKD